MKKLVFSLLFGFPVLLYSQINTRTGGSINVLPNSPTTNTNVGIGTNTPSEKLDVNGNVKSKKIIALNNENSSTLYANVDSWYNSSQVFGAGKELPSSILGTKNYMFQFFDLHGNNSVPDGVVEGDDYLAFEIKDRGNKRRFLFDSHLGGGASNGKLKLEINDGLGNNSFKFNDNGLGNVFIHLPKENSRIVIAGWGDYLPEHKFVVRGSSMIEGNILTDSNIGIGTNLFTDGSDNYRLSVNGAVRAHRVKVYTSWADFVFEDGYQLPTLEEVEKHINEKGHLKDIPTAEEVEKSGIELGEMNKLLLQKVEELTLYLIEVNKELEKVKSELNDIRHEK